MNRKLITRILIAAVGIIVVWNIVFTTEAKTEYKTEKLQTGTISQEIDFTATWYPVGYAKVSLGNYQDIRNVYVKEGQTVTAGKVIAQLNDDLEVSQLNTARSSYYAAINNKSASEKAAKSAPGGLNDASRATLTQLQGVINTAYRQVQTAEISVNKKKVKAPIAGKVVAVVYEDFGTASASLTTSLTGATPSGSNYIIIASEKDHRLQTTFSEQDVVLLKKDMGFTMTSRVTPEIYAGKVQYVSAIPVAQTATTTDEPSYKVILNVESYPKNLPYGARLEGAVKIAQKEDAKLVSYDAVTMTSTETGTVLVKNGEGTTEKTVKIGIVGEEFIEITEGLSDSDEIVVDVLPEKNVLTLRPWIKKIISK